MSNRINGTVLLATPEFITGLPPGFGNLAGRSLNYKVGGMADVSPPIVDAIRALNPNLDIHIALPRWKSSLEQLSKMSQSDITDFQRICGRNNVHSIQHASLDRVRINNSNTGMYQPDDFGFTETDRALAFTGGIINQVLPQFDFDVVCYNDWMPGILGAAAKSHGARSFAWLHNIFTHSVSWEEARRIGGINYTDFGQHIYKDENGNIDLLATAIHAADYISTVSPEFLKEVAENRVHTDIYPPYLQALIADKYHNGRAIGVLNPLQVSTSSFKKAYESQPLDEVIADRKAKRAELARNQGLDVDNSPLILFPSRLYSSQKSPETLFDAAPALIDRGMQILVHASGEKKHVEKALELANRYPGRVAYSSFSNELETLTLVSDGIYTAMTSHYEPCGGPNVNHPAYGTLIIGHEVGGIKDTTRELSVANNTGNGFTYMGNNTADGFYAAALRANHFHTSLNDKQRYEQLIRICNEAHHDFSADRAGEAYSAVIEQLIYEKRHDDSR